MTCIYIPAIPLQQLPVFEQIYVLSHLIHHIEYWFSYFWVLSLRHKISVFLCLSILSVILQPQLLSLDCLDFWLFSLTWPFPCPFYFAPTSGLIFLIAISFLKKIQHHHTEINKVSIISLVQPSKLFMYWLLVLPFLFHSNFLFIPTFALL